MSDIHELHAEILVDLHLQLEQENFQVTPESVEIFKKLGIKIERLPLENSLAHGSPLVRGIAAKLLGRLKDTKSIHNLQAIRQDEDAWVRSMAYEALGNFSGIEVAELIATGLDDADWKVRGIAIQTIAPYRLESALDKLVTLLKEETSEEVKAACARALSFFDEPTLSEPLTTALQSALPRTRAMALKALGTKPPYEPAFELVQGALQDPHPWVRSSAAWCLGSWDHFDFCDSLKSLMDDPEIKVQQAAVHALGTILHHRITLDEHSGEIDALRQNLNNTWLHKLEATELDTDYVISLLEATSRLRYPLSESQRSIVENWANHQDEHIRLSAIKVLCNCAAWESREHLLDIFEQVNEAPQIRAATLELLSKQLRFQEDPTLRDRIRSITGTWFDQENAWLVGAALWASANMNFTEFGAQVISHLNNHNPEVRGRACQIAAQLEAPNAHKALIYTLREDVESIVRYTAAQSLLQYCGDEEVQDALMYALNDEDTSVQISCAQTLCKASYGRTIKTLQNVLLGDETPLKLATARSLKDFQHPEWIQWIQDNAQDESQDLVREALEETLEVLIANQKSEGEL